MRKKALTAEAASLSTAEVAKALGVSPRTVRRMARELDGQRIGLRRLKFKPSVIAAHVASRSA